MIKPYVTELDFTLAALPAESIRFLVDVMPGAEVEGDSGWKSYDCGFV
jgi:hypothetical protein